MKKRIIALLMALCLVVGLVPAVSAETLDTGLEYVVHGGDWPYVEITGYTGTASEVIIPNEIEGMPVYYIGENAFKSCENLIRVTIPDSINSIYSMAFAFCANLREVVFQGQAPYISWDAFRSVTATAYAPYDDTTWTAEKMENYMGTLTWVGGCGEFFTHNDTGLTYWVAEDHVGIAGYDGTAAELSIPAEIDGFPVTVIGYNAFSDCSILTSVTLPNGVTKIDSEAFSGCSNLLSINLSSELTCIGDQAFSSCVNLVSVSIPDSVTSIGMYAFSYCKNLTSVAIPDGVTSIEIGTFSGCQNLSQVTIGNGVTEIGFRAFENSTYLTVIFEGDAPNIDSQAFINTTATVLYPAHSTSWTADVMQDYSGTLRWVAYHEYTTVTTAPTCTEAGFTTYTCSVCGDTFVTDEVAALGHTEEVIPAVTPTCTDNGLTEGKRCTVCGEITVDQEEIPSLGHKWHGTGCENCDTTRNNPFADVPEDSFFIDSVLWAVENNITSGTAHDKFSPYDSCLRSQVVTFLWRAAGEPKAEAAVNPFEDVKPTDYYYDAVLWAVENGITYGADDKHFEPNGVCNRSQVVSFLYRTFKNPPVEGSGNPFQDVPNDAWYAAAVQWAVKEGIAYGLSESEFGPDDICSRSQVVTFLYRAYVN